MTSLGQRSCTTKGGGAESGPARRQRPGPRVALTVLALAAGTALGPAAAQSTRPTPSGLPVPRWVVLKFDTVNARAGPGDDHRLVWVYRAKGLPVQVVAETFDWRRVCDPEGGMAWVHKRTTDGKRNVLNLAAAPAPLRAKAGEYAAAQALLVPRGLASLDRCKEGWCRIKAEGGGGWSPEGALWGTGEARRCKR